MFALPGLRGGEGGSYSVVVSIETFLHRLESNRETKPAGDELHRLISFAVGDLLAGGGTLTQITFFWQGEEATTGLFANGNISDQVRPNYTPPPTPLPRTQCGLTCLLPIRQRM